MSFLGIRNIKNNQKKDCIKKSIDEFVPIYTFIPSLKKSTPLIFPKHFMLENLSGRSSILLFKKFIF